MLPHSSSYTRFPYTTLFRSLGGGQVRLDLDLGQLRLVLDLGTRQARNVLQRRADLLGLRSQHFEVGPLDADDDRMARPRQDRKSTRLNSSHSQISYAVFCFI